MWIISFNLHSHLREMYSCPLWQIGKPRLRGLANQSGSSNCSLFGSSHLCSVVSFTSVRMIPGPFSNLLNNFISTKLINYIAMLPLRVLQQSIVSKNLTSMQKMNFYYSCGWTDKELQSKGHNFNGW